MAFRRRAFLRTVLSGAAVAATPGSSRASFSGGATREGSADGSTAPRFDNWQSACRTYWRAGNQVLATGSTLRYLGASWQPYGNPASDPDSQGAWRHSFLLGSVGVRLVERENGEVAFASSGQLSNSFEVATGIGPYRWVLDGEGGLGDLGFLSSNPLQPRERDRIDHVNTRGYDAAGERLSLNPYHDPDLYGFTTSASLRKAVEDERGLLHDVTDAPSDGVGSQATASRLLSAEAREDLGAAIPVVLTGLSLVSGPVGVAATTLGALLTVGSALEAVEDEERMPGDIPRAYGFGARRAGGAGPIEAGFVLFDAVVAPGAQQAFYVKPKHRQQSVGPRTPFARFGGDYLGYTNATVQPIWLVGVSGAAPDGDPSNATARLLGANFERWRDEPSNGRYWRQAPRPGIEGPGTWIEERLTAAAERKIIEKVNPVPPATTAGTSHTYDASGTMLAGRPIAHYDWGFRRISRAAWERANRATIGGLDASRLYDPVALAILFDVTDLATDTSRAAIEGSLASLTDLLDAFEFPVSGRTTGPTFEATFDESGLWGAVLVVTDEGGMRGAATALVNVGDVAPSLTRPTIDRIATPGAPLEIGDPERFVAEGVEVPGTETGPGDLTYEWHVAPVDAALGGRETGGRALTDAATITSQSGREAEIRFNTAGEYVVRVFATEPDSKRGTGIASRRLFLVGRGTEREQARGEGSRIESFERSSLSGYDVVSGGEWRITSDRSTHGERSLTRGEGASDSPPTLNMGLFSFDEVLARGNEYAVDYYIDTEAGAARRFHDLHFLFAVQSEGSYYDCTLNNGGLEFRLQKVKDGEVVSSVEADGTVGRTNEWDTLRLAFGKDGTIRCAVAGGSVVLEDTEFQGGGYGFGYTGRGERSYWDNLRRGAQADQGSGSGSGPLNDDFDYPTSELGANGWRVTQGRIGTEQSRLVRLDDRSSDVPRAEAAHDQPAAAGRFEFTLRNDARYYGLKIPFIARSSVTDPSKPRFGSVTGYRLTVRQDRYGDVLLSRVDSDGAETLVQADGAGSGGKELPIVIERDPGTYEFRLSVDGEVVGTARDTTYTESEELLVRFGGNAGSQSVDRISVTPPDGSG